LGILAGSLWITLSKPAKNKTAVIFVSCAITCFGGVVQSLTHTPLMWSIAAFVSYLCAALLNANLTTVMRTQIPVEMQGRVFSAKDTLQNCLIPLGLFIGGILADRVYEPFMATVSPVQQILGHFFGTGKGAGIALMFFCTGLLGTAISLTQLFIPNYKELNEGCESDSKT